jgi:phosphatidyl-myo-inositol dimannoside synthase
MSAELDVLVITPDFPPGRGGIQLLVHRLVTAWQRARPQVITLAPRASGGTPHRWRDDGARRISVPVPVGHPGRVACLNLAAVVRALRSRPDAVLSAHIVAGPAAVAIARALRVPFVQYLHGEEVARRPGLVRLVARHASALVAVSRSTEELARAQGAAPERLHRIPPGVDPPGSPPCPRDDRPSVVTVSRLRDRYKGHDVMIRALPLIRTRVPEVRWVVVGDGPLRRALEAQVDALDLGPHVHLAGEVDDAERDRWLDRCHVLAMPSRLSGYGGGEGFGIAYLEAGAHRLPVVAGDIAGARDAVVDGETGILVDPEDHLAVAEAVAGLLTDAPRACAMGEAGARRARMFAWPSIARRVEDLLISIASGERGPV